MYRPPTWKELTEELIISEEERNTEILATSLRQDKSFWMIEFRTTKGDGSCESEVLCYINLTEAQVGEDGLVDIHVHREKITSDYQFLEKEFNDPFIPTKEECILFEIEHGEAYPLLKYLKEDPYAL